MGLIFAVPGHIEQIKSGEKTQTRRLIAPRTALQEGKEGLELRVNGRLKADFGRRADQGCAEGMRAVSGRRVAGGQSGVLAGGGSAGMQVV